jgi:hypothetical protein
MKTPEEIEQLTDLAYSIIEQGLKDKDPMIRIRTAIDVTNLLTSIALSNRQKNSEDLIKKTFKQVGLVEH